MGCGMGSARDEEVQVNREVREVWWGSERRSACKAPSYPSSCNAPASALDARDG